MNREILFRGKTLNGKWVFGNLVVHSSGECSIISYAEYKKKSYQWFDVRPGTVGQYIGIKNKKCEKIFEGDLVSDGVKVREVKYSDFLPLYLMKSSVCVISQGLTLADWERLEIVGSIHTNPELLEQSGE